MIYTIYSKAALQQSDDLVAVPENLAPWALIAPPVWLAVHRLWWWLATYALFVMLTMAISTTSYVLVAMVLSWLPGVYLLLEGRELYRRKLEERGMELVVLINADSEDEAIARHVARAQLQRPQFSQADELIESPRSRLLPASAPNQSASGVFGLFSPGES
ncbi:MAG: DUF2628 domain-containing protein [Rhizobiaceae bacterium]